MTTIFIEKHFRNSEIDNHLLKLKMMYHMKKIELCKAGADRRNFGGLSFSIVKLQLGPGNL